MSKAGKAIYEGLVEPDYLALENYDRVEEEGLNAPMLGKWTLWFIMVMIFILILSYYYSVVNLMTFRDKLATETVYPEKVEVQLEAKEKLEQYGYTAGNYTIPIEKAMALIASQKTTQVSAPVAPSQQP